MEKSIACVEINLGLIPGVGQEAFAALPPDVRKGSAFPQHACSYRCGSAARCVGKGYAFPIHIRFYRCGSARYVIVRSGEAQPRRCDKEKVGCRKAGGFPHIRRHSRKAG